SRSMTVVGDVAQTSSAAGTRDWTIPLETMVRRNYRVAELTVNYRTPAQIMHTARAVATAADPDHPPAALRSAREVPQALVITESDDVVDGVREVLLAEHDGAAQGTVAVIAAPGRQPELSGALGIVAGPEDLS